MKKNQRESFQNLKNVLSIEYIRAISLIFIIAFLTESLIYLLQVYNKY
jgi:hypothetical protein